MVPVPVASVSVSQSGGLTPAESVSVKVSSGSTSASSSVGRKRATAVVPAGMVSELLVRSGPEKSSASVVTWASVHVKSMSSTAARSSLIVNPMAFPSSALASPMDTDTGFSTMRKFRGPASPRASTASSWMTSLKGVPGLLLTRRFLSIERLANASRSILRSRL